MKDKAAKKTYERPVIQRLNAGLSGKFGATQDNSTLTHIDGVPVADLLKGFGSPLFILSEKTIRQTFRNAQRAFSTRYPKVQFAWSYKTNYLAAVCNIFHQEGSWAEVVSGFEYRKALENNVPGDRIIFNGPGKTSDDLALAIENRSLIHIDHADELEMLLQLATESVLQPRVAVRVNMDTGMYPSWDRFGFNLESGEAWETITTVMQSGKLRLEGLHCHIGTFVMSPSAYSKATAKMCSLATRLKKEFSHVISYLDMGGGFASGNTLKGSYLQGTDGAPGFDRYANAITTEIHNAGFDPDELPLLILETGRALVDEAGYLAGKVIAHKRLADGRRATISDVGVNILFTSYWYDHKISTNQDATQFNEETVIYGPLCMNIDVVREQVSLPPLKKEDILIVHNVGAYNMTQWMQFISLRPAVVLIDNNEHVHLVRKRETNETLSSQEIVPQHLQFLQK